MTPDEALIALRAGIRVTPQRVTISKAIILEQSKLHTSSSRLLEELLAANEIPAPNQLIIHESVDTSAALSANAEAISWRMAGCEAIWALIHAGLLLPLSNHVYESAVSVSWTTVVPGSGGMSGGWSIAESQIPVPIAVRRAPSHENSSDQFLSEPDLYLHTIGVPSMHDDIAAAFREAVRCFRAELFTASIAMLGKASEGSWLELGAALLAVVPPADQTRYAGQRRTLEDPMAGPAKKAEAVVAIYEHQESFGHIATLTGIRPRELRRVFAWSDAVRDSRNTIHFGVDAAVPNTYETLAALLISAVPNIKTLYRIRDAATNAAGREG